MKMQQAIIAKLTVKKIHSLIDHIQILMTHHLAGHPVGLTLHDWVDEARIHLRKLENSVETGAE